MRVGILGAGGMGNAHARHYARMSDVDVIFFERSSDRAKEFAEKHSVRPCKSADDLMSEADIVDICLPTDLHCEYALRSIAAGRATLVEKPIAGTLEEGARLIEAAAKVNVPLGTAQVVRYFPEFKHGHDLVISGKVGTPAAARTRRGGAAPKGGSDNWFMDHHRSGGVLIDLAVHDFDWLRWTLGEVKSLFSRSVGAKSMKGPDYALTTLTFDSGAVAHVEATWMDPSGFRTTFEVCGSGGMIEFDSRRAPSLKTSTEGKVANEAPLGPQDDPYYRELRDFVDAITNEKQPPVTGSDGLMALSIGLAALESAQSGKVVSPAREF